MRRIECRTCKAMRRGERVNLPMLGIVAAALWLLGCGLPSWAQTSAASWPQRNVRFILPFSAGSGTDVAARLVGDRLASRWSKSVIIENRPGGDNLIAIKAFLSANDDHVLLFASSATFLAHPYVHEKLGYNFELDMVPIAKVADTVLVAAVPASSAIASIAQFVEQARAAPEKFNMAGAAGLPEFAIDAFLKSEMLASARVPYRDVVGAVRDLGEGRIQFLLTSLAVVRPFAEAGKVRIIAAGSRGRSPMQKDVPSIPEAGYPVLAAETSVALYGPKELSLELRDRIAADVIAVVTDEKISSAIAATGQDPGAAGPQELLVTLTRQASNTAAIAKILGMERKQ